MLLACVQGIVSDSTRVGLLGDPCQVKSLLKTLTTVASLHSSCTLGISTMQCFLDRFLHAGPKGQEIVHRIDLLNRYQGSHRCRVRATTVINMLTPYCLPCPSTATPTLWSQKVFGKKVWADLQPVTPKSGFQKQLTQCTPEILSVWPDICFRMPENMPLNGFIGKSRFDIDQALYAALTAVAVAWTQITL